MTWRLTALASLVLLGRLGLACPAARAADEAATSDRAVSEQEQDPQATASTAKNAPEASDDDDIRLKFSWNDGLVGVSGDQAYRVHLGGRFDFDSGWYSAPASIQNSLNTPLLDGTDFRRFRFEADGTIGEQVEFKLEADFSRAADFKDFQSTPQTNIFITNAWVAVHDLPVVDTVRAGHQKEYLTFANATSSKFYPFMERPYIFDAYEDDFSFDSGISTNRTYFDQRLTTWVGAFWNGTRSQAFNVGGDYAATARATWMPVYDEARQRWLNLGVSGSLRSLASNPEVVSVRPLVRTGQSFDVPDLIKTATIYGRDGLQLLGAGVHGGGGPWTMGGEFLCRFTPHAFTGGLPNPDGTLPPGVQAVGSLFFSGFYVEVLYFLTAGDHQPVDRVIPGYDRVRPARSFSCCRRGQRGPGAWEIGARYDYVNVNSGLIAAGQLSSVTLGLNWYLNPNARIMANYVFTDRDTGSASGSGSFSALGLRFHFDF